MSYNKHNFKSLEPLYAYELNEMDAQIALNEEETQLLKETVSLLPTELPIASNSTLGGIKVGSNLSIATDGTLSVTEGTSISISSISESTVDGGNNVVNFSDGKKLNIKNGQRGTPGQTPVKGTDYWTEADRQQMVNDVIAALPDASEVSY